MPVPAPVAICIHHWRLLFRHFDMGSEERTPRPGTPLPNANANIFWGNLAKEIASLSEVSLSSTVDVSLFFYILDQLVHQGVASRQGGGQEEPGTYH